MALKMPMKSRRWNGKSLSKALTLASFVVGQNHFLDGALAFLTLLRDARSR